MIRAHVHFPTHHANTEPLRTCFDADATRPSLISIYKPNARGKLVLVQAVVPKAAIETPKRGRPRKG